MERISYPQFSAEGEVRNESASLDLVPVQGTDTYLKIEYLAISIIRAATGGYGLVRLQDTLGRPIYTTNADGVKDLVLEFGEEGLQVGPGVGIQLVTQNAKGEQASASCAIKGHKTTWAE